MTNATLRSGSPIGISGQGRRFRQRSILNPPWFCERWERENRGIRLTPILSECCHYSCDRRDCSEITPIQGVMFCHHQPNASHISGRTCVSGLSFGGGCIVLFLQDESEQKKRHAQDKCTAYPNNDTGARPMSDDERHDMVYARGFQSSCTSTATAGFAYISCLCHRTRLSRLIQILSDGLLVRNGIPFRIRIPPPIVNAETLTHFQPRAGSVL